MSGVGVLGEHVRGPSWGWNGVVRWRGDGWGRQLPCVGVWVREWGHVWWHVAMVLVVMGACRALLVHVRMVGWWGHAVQVVGCPGWGRGWNWRAFTWWWSSRAIGGGGGGCGCHTHLVHAAEHLRLHLERHGRPAAVLTHHFHGGGIVVGEVGGQGWGVLGVKLHVRHWWRDPRRWGRLQGKARWRRWGEVRGVGGDGGRRDS